MRMVKVYIIKRYVIIFILVILLPINVSASDNTDIVAREASIIEVYVEMEKLKTEMIIMQNHLFTILQELIKIKMNMSIKRPERPEPQIYRPEIKPEIG